MIFPEIIAVMEAKGYIIYDNPAGFDLNIVGVRSTQTSNKFDDTLIVFYRQNDDWIYNFFKITTDPGLYWLNHPLSELGTAILKPGQYTGMWKIGLHRGKYQALVQKSQCTVIRDDNQDNLLDFDSSVEETGLFGINCHRSSTYGESIQVDKWSAGCQVFADIFQYRFFLELCKEGRKNFGNSFTYTLLTELDFE